MKKMHYPGHYGKGKMSKKKGHPSKKGILKGPGNALSPKRKM